MERRTALDLALLAGSGSTAHHAGSMSSQGACKRRRRPWIGPATVFCVVAAGFGCGPSEGQIRDEFRRYVHGANQCEEARECALVYPGCPLGCFVAMRSDRAAEVERKAQQLIEDYESDTTSCEYGCPPPGAVQCVDGRCSVEVE